MFKNKGFSLVWLVIIVILLVSLILFFYPKKYTYAPVNLDTGPAWKNKCIGFESIKLGPPGGSSSGVCYGYHYFY
ncbi:MAG: hypothetical protein WC264_01395 [Candidatus Paceibacterota bacterium]|jgi:hypothetical protein